MFECDVCEEFYADEDFGGWVKTVEGEETFTFMCCVSCVKGVLRDGGEMAELDDCGCCPKK